MLAKSPSFYLQTSSHHGHVDHCTSNVVNTGIFSNSLWVWGQLIVEDLFVRIPTFNCGLFYSCSTFDLLLLLDKLGLLFPPKVVMRAFGVGLTWLTLAHFGPSQPIRILNLNLNSWCLLEWDQLGSVAKILACVYTRTGASWNNEPFEQPVEATNCYQVQTTNNSSSL